MKIIFVFFIFLLFVTEGYTQNSDYKKVLDKIDRIIEQKTADSVTVLDFTDYDINVIPKKVYELKNLRALILNNTNINDIPVEIKRNKNLEILLLSGTQLKEFPTSLFSMKKIKILSLNYTKVTSIPVGISGMTNLRELSIMFNSGIQHISSEILQNEKLEVFYICYYKSPKMVKRVIDKLIHKGIDVSNACR